MPHQDPSPIRRASKALTLFALAASMAAVHIPAHADTDPRIQQGDLLIENHSFEDGLTGWTPTNGRGGPASKQCGSAVTTGPDGATDLDAAAQFEGAPPCVTSGLLSSPVDAVAGEAYTVFADASGSGQVSLGLRFLDESGAVIESTHSERTRTDGEFVEFTATAPAGTSTVAVEIGAQKQVQVDDVRITAPYTNLGPQITRRGTFLAMAAGYDENGRAVTFAVATGNAHQPAVLVVTDVLTKEVTQTVDLVGATGSWTIEQAPDGTVYVGTYQRAQLYAWTPGDAESRVVGSLPLSGYGMVYGLNSAPDGTLYGGSWGEPAEGYEGAQLWSYHPDSGFSKFGPTLRTDAYYTRAVAYEETSNTVWAGTGTRPGLWGCDADTEECTDYSELLGDLILSKQWVYGITAGGGYVQVWGGDSGSTGNDALVILKVGRDASGAITAERVAEIPRVIYNGSSVVVDGKVYYNKALTSPEIPLYSYDLATGTETVIDEAPAGIFSRQWEVLDLNDPAWPGLSLVGWNSQGIMAVYNIETGNFSRERIEGIPLMSTGLISLTAGPEGDIWSAGYLTGGLGFVTPMRDDRQATYVVGGQAEYMISYEDRVYQGIYPYGQIQSFSPDSIHDGGRPRTDCTIGENQNRPYALLGHGDRVYYGSQADYGHDMGAFGWLDLETGECTTLSEEVGHHSINTLTASGGKIFGGSNIYYAWDALPVDSEGYLLVFDEATSEIQKLDLPVDGLRSVNALATDADGTVWAYAEGWLLALDPETLEWIHVEEILPDWKPGERISGSYAALVAHPDGRIYGEVAHKGVFSFDPAAVKDTGSADSSFQVLYEGNTLWLTVDEYGNLWTIHDSTQLLRINPRAVVS